MKYEITNLDTNEKITVDTLDEVAAIIEIDADDVAYCLEDIGYAETDAHRVVEIV